MTSSAHHLPLVHIDKLTAHEQRSSEALPHRVNLLVRGQIASIKLGSHLGEMHFFPTYGDVYNYYKTYGFPE